MSAALTSEELAFLRQRQDERRRAAIVREFYDTLPLVHLDHGRRRVARTSIARLREIDAELGDAERLALVEELEQRDREIDG